MRKLITNRKNSGDTIIEVLICLAALGFILSITYSIATRAQQSVRSAQERIEALKLAEGQIEQLKYIAQFGTSPDEIFTPTVSTFCLNGSAITSVSSFETDLFADDLSGYPNQCVSGLYHISVRGPSEVSPTTTDNGGRYEVRVRWQRLGGGVNEEVKLDYEQYKEN